MDKVIVYENFGVDGGVCIVNPTPAWFKSLTKTEKVKVKKGKKTVTREKKIDVNDIDEALGILSQKVVPKYSSFLSLGETVDEAKERMGVKDLDAQVPFKIVNVSDLPESRNYRDAWTVDLKIDLEKAKKQQKRLMIAKMWSRVPRDEFGDYDAETLAKTKQEIIELKPVIEKAKSIDEVYNTWAKSIDNRNGKRKYKT